MNAETFGKNLKGKFYRSPRLLHRDFGLSDEPTVRGGRREWEMEKWKKKKNNTHTQGKEKKEKDEMEIKMTAQSILSS